MRRKRPTHHELVLRSPGLLSYWRLGEASGNFADQVGGKTGSATGGITYGVAGAIPTSFDKAVTFDGTTGYIAFADTDFEFLGTAPFSVAAWVNVAALSNTPVILGKGAGVEGWRLEHTSIGQVLFRRQTTAGNDSSTAAPLRIGAWVHVAGVYDGTTVRVFTGVRAGSGAASTRSLIHNTDPFTIGSLAGSATRFVSGSVDEVAIWNRALGRSEIIELAAGRG